MFTPSGVVRRSREQPSSAPQSSRPQAISPPPQYPSGSEQAMKVMRMRVKKIFDLFVPAGDDALGGSALEDFTDQIATHFGDEIGEDAIEFGPFLDAEGTLTFDGFLSWWRERQGRMQPQQ